MTTTIAHCNRNGAGGSRGFTLTEIMVAMSLGLMISAAVLSSFGFIGRSSLGIAHYSTMNSESRNGLELFARDVRMAQDISGFSETGLTLHIPVGSGGTSPVIYRYNSEAKTFEREDAAGEIENLMRHVEEFVFRRFTVLQEEATNNLGTKQIQLQLRMVRPVLQRETSDKVISARYIMRNKRVST